jgi:Subtilase family
MLRSWRHAPAMRRTNGATICRGQSRPRHDRLRLEVLEARDVPAGVHPTIHRFEPPSNVAPFGTSGPTGYTPAQVRHAYGFDQISFTGGVVGDGAGQTIAIVDAFDNPNVANDLHQFDLQFGLADLPVFTKVNQNGGTAMPPANAGWASEIALDVEWAHAIAPRANILLVVANDNSFANLLTAVDYARSQPGVTTVSMSWGAVEFSGEASFDSHFTTPAGHAGVTFIASSGDRGAPPSYPAISKNVLAVGGTTFQADGAGNYLGESGWGGSGGGISRFVAQPPYQAGVVTQSSTFRTSPDVAYDANPSTGFPVYDSFNNGTAAPWSQFGGTSAGAPQWAALVAIANQGRVLAGLTPLDGPGQLLPKIYTLPAQDFHDVTTGSSTGQPPLSAGPGYDLVTGRGSPFANRVVADLVGAPGNRPPVLAAIADRVIPASQDVATVPLSATDPDGDPVSFSATAQSLAYVLDQQLGLSTDGNLWLNYGGRQEKWVLGSGGVWYFIVPTGELYRWDGVPNTANGTLMGNVGASYYANIALLYDAVPDPHAALSVSGTTLTVDRENGFVGAVVVIVTAGDGHGGSDSKTFTLTVTTP